jgi:hypothetical protein
MGQTVSSEIHAFKVDAGLVPGPFHMKREEDAVLSPTEPVYLDKITTQHSKFDPGLISHKSFAVSVESLGRSFYATSETETSYGGPRPEPGRNVGRIGMGWNYRDSQPIGIYTFRDDHLDLIEHGRIDGRSLASLDKDIILHHADPFGFEPKKDSNNRKFFQEHSQVTAEIIPSDAIANRLDLIAEARLNGRKMASKIHTSFAEEAAVNLAEIGASVAIHHSAHTGGGLLNILTASSTAAAGKAAIATAGVTAPLMVLSKIAERAMRIRRMKSVEKESGRLKNESNGILSEAKHHRDIYLEHVDNIVNGLDSHDLKTRWSNKRRNLIDAWNKGDDGLKNYLKILSDSVYGQYESIPKEFARSLLTLVAYETKLSFIAERRLLRDLKDFATELESRGTLNRFVGETIRGGLQSTIRSRTQNRIMRNATQADQQSTPQGSSYTIRGIENAALTSMESSDRASEAQRFVGETIRGGLQSTIRSRTQNRIMRNATQADQQSTPQGSSYTIRDIENAALTSMEFSDRASEAQRFVGETIRGGLQSTIRSRTKNRIMRNATQADQQSTP